MSRTKTKTQVSTRTKVLVGIAACGIAVAAGLGYFGSTRTNSFPSIRSLVTQKNYTYPESHAPKNELLVTQIPLSDVAKKLPDMNINPGGKRMDLYSFKVAPAKDPSVFGNISIKQFSFLLTLPKNAIIGQFGLRKKTGNLTKELPTSFQDLYTVQAFKLPNPTSVLHPNIFKDSFSFITPFADDAQYVVVFTFQDELKVSGFGDLITMHGKVLFTDPAGGEQMSVKLNITELRTENGYLVNNRRTDKFPASPSIVHLMRILPLEDPSPNNYSAPFIYQGNFYFFPGEFVYSDGSGPNHNTSLGTAGGTGDWYLRGRKYPEEFDYENFSYPDTAPGLLPGGADTL